MILPTIFLFGAIGYLFYSSKKELLIEDDIQLENSKDDDYEELEDLFI